MPPAGIPEAADRPALRSWDRPDRVAGAPHGESCHYHLYPTDDMAFHREVRCHWHEDPRDPSIRYVR